MLHVVHSMQEVMTYFFTMELYVHDKNGAFLIVFLPRDAVQVWPMLSYSDHLSVSPSLCHVHGFY